MSVTEIINLLTGIMTVVVVPVLAAFFKYKLDALKVQNDTATVERAKASAVVLEVKDHVETLVGSITDERSNQKQPS